MSTILTTAGLSLLAKAANGQAAVKIDKMYFAYHPGISAATPADPAWVVPSMANVKHVADIAGNGKVTSQKVVYTAILDASLGDWMFNWVGLFDSTNNVLIAVAYQNDQQKYKTNALEIGNTIYKNFAIQYNNAAELLGITLDAATWQVDISDKFASKNHDHQIATATQSGFISPDMASALLNATENMIPNTIVKRNSKNFIAGHLADNGLFRKYGLISPYLQYVPAGENQETPLYSWMRIVAGTMIAFGEMRYWEQDEIFDASDKLDTGTIQPGKDYFVYLTTEGGIAVSLNATYPAGNLADGTAYSASNCTLLGGFHTLCAAVPADQKVNEGTVNEYTHGLAGKPAGAILPDSVWCHTHKPAGSVLQTGMVYDAMSDIWVDIYPQTTVWVESGSSEFGGTVRHYNMVSSANFFRLRWKRLPTFTEFCSFLHGHPEGTAIAGGADPLTAGGHSGADGKRLVSDIGVEDGPGVWWHWLDDMGPSGIWVPNQAANGTYNHLQQWVRYGDTDKGRMYGGIFALRSGGAWNAAQTDATGYTAMTVIDSSLQANEADEKTTARGVAAAYHG